MAEAAIDLHTHSRCSDGRYSPSELVRNAKQTGLSAIALTDHDTIAGVESAIEAGRELGVEVIPGVEISAQHEFGTLHILGYFIDIHSGILQKFLNNYLESRNYRNPLILKRLTELGYPLHMEDVTRVTSGDVINRPHIAKAMIDKGYVQSKKEAFDYFLGQGKAAYVAKEVYTPKETVEIIHEAKGLAVLAHPALLNGKGLLKTGDEIVRLHREAGFDGIEAYHGDCICDHADFYASIAKELGLFSTGGSDFHGDNFHQHLGLTRCLNPIPYRILENMKQTLADKTRMLDIQ